MISGSYCCIEMGVASDELIKPICLQLWEEAKKLFEEKSIDTIKTFYVKDNLYWKQLFDEIGFEYRCSVYRFEYKGSKFNEADLFTVNRGPEQNSGGVNLNALANNENALKLYIGTGFRMMQAQDCRMLLTKE